MRCSDETISWTFESIILSVLLMTWVLIPVFVFLFQAYLKSSLWMVFSISRNALFLCASNTFNNSKAEQFQLFEALRVLSLLWIMWGHMQILLPGYQNDDVAIRGVINNNSYLASSYFVSVGTFFWISGFLGFRSVSRQMKRQKENVFLAKIPVIAAYRYTRIAPLYFIIMACTWVIIPRIGKGSGWSRYFYLLTGKANVVECETNLLENILFLSNYTGNHFCLPWTWYLAVDFQLYLTLPFFIVAFESSPSKGVISCIICVLISLLCVMFADSYVGAHTRITPFVFGVLTSWGLQRELQVELGTVAVDKDVWPDVCSRDYNNTTSESFDTLELKLLTFDSESMGIADVGDQPTPHRATSLFHKKSHRWSSYLIGCLCLSVVLAVYHSVALKATRNVIISNVELTVWRLSREIFWGFGVTLVIAPLVSGNSDGLLHRLLSHPFWLPVGKLTYGTYLIHPVVIVVYRCLHPIEWYSWQSYVICFVLVVLFSFTLAVVMYLFFERPAEQLLRDNLTCSATWGVMVVLIVVSISLMKEAQ